MLFSFCSFAHAGTTGKITGKVTDAETGEPLPGANILIAGSTLGAAADLEGEFIILNVPPGIHTVEARMMGYQAMRTTNVRVASDQTTVVNFVLRATTLELGEAVTVVAERPLVQKDLTSSLAVVGAAEIEQLPVQEIGDVIQLQAGVTKGSGGELHIRGGRAGEVAYLIDGVLATDPFSNAIAVEVSNASVQELQVVSGTFNAEYGQAMSGVIDIATKDGGNKLAGEVSYYGGDYLSRDKTLFLNIDEISPTALRNLELNLSGPIPAMKDKLSFLFNGRYFYNEGWLYGRRVFMPDDSSNFDSPDPQFWYIEKSGDGKIVPMNPYRKYSMLGKLTYRLAPAMKLAYSLLWHDVNAQYYDHLFKLNPEGNYHHFSNGQTHTLNWTHTLSSRTFYTIKASRAYTGFKSYVFEDPFDPRYVDSKRLFRHGAFSFHTGGTGMWHNYRSTTSLTGRFDWTSQISKRHQMKTGIEYRRHRLWLHQFELQFFPEISSLPVIQKIDAYNHNRYVRTPEEFSAYWQDKMEFKNAIINLGVRYDYFNSHGKVPTDLRDPSNTYYPRPENQAYVNASAKQQISPRLGVAYPITDRGVLHFSYGHFFQIPAYQFLYDNPEFEIIPGGLSTLVGNADLEPQKTVTYEVGLQQQFGESIGMDVTGFYKDIRDLLGTEIHELYILGDRYARYVNRDYGNVRGVTLAFSKRHSHAFSVNVNYTYQVAEGNASDPRSVFYNQQSNPPRASEIQVVPLDWDQTHTLNFDVTVGDAKTWGISLIGQLGSGLPYTPEEQNIRIDIENSARKPPQYNFNLRAYRTFRIAGLEYSAFLRVFNLLDRRNENFVYLDTGRAGYTLVSRYAGDVRGVNTLEEFLRRPDWYAEPRQMVLGLSVGF
ncbi:MAG: TonB-dependent receptor [candidate division KSB1 bacterium]|nr:TonB-dependent receptor [candidate division KSB1 bacterium]